MPGLPPEVAITAERQQTELATQSPTEKRDAERVRRAVKSMEEASAPPVYQIEGVLSIVQYGNYEYERPAHTLKTRLVLSPPLTYGYQRVTESEFRFAPLPHAMPEHTDEWGNTVIEAHHERVFSHLTLVAELTVQTACRYDANDKILPTPIAPVPHLIEPFRHPTALTTPDESLLAVAREIESDRQAGDTDEWARAWAVCERVYRQMHFNSGVTGVRTSAAEAWANKAGVCQDYAHIMVTVLREMGMAARYVSGFLPAEGAMHAWVEVLLPLPVAREDGTGARAWFALDPTHCRWVGEKYVTVAVGRDYRDIAPTSGTYFGGKSQLRHLSRVTLTASTRVDL